jgi:hypothetical protein
LNNIEGEVKDFREKVADKVRDSIKLAKESAEKINIGKLRIKVEKIRGKIRRLKV